MEKLKARVPTPVVNEVFNYIAGIPRTELDWPIHRWDPTIMKLLAYIPRQDGQICDPQIVVQEKGTEPYFMEFHTDDAPEWAEERRYQIIVGVAITEQNYQNGGLSFIDYTGVVTPSFWPGTIFTFYPEEKHSPGVNQRDAPRVAVYFRFLHWGSPKDEDSVSLAETTQYKLT